MPSVCSHHSALLEKQARPMCSLDGQGSCCGWQGGWGGGGLLDALVVLAGAVVRGGAHAPRAQEAQRRDVRHLPTRGGQGGVRRAAAEKRRGGRRSAQEACGRGGP